MRARASLALRKQGCISSLNAVHANHALHALCADAEHFIETPDKQAFSTFLQKSALGFQHSHQHATPPKNMANVWIALQRCGSSLAFKQGGKESSSSMACGHWKCMSTGGISRKDYLWGINSKMPRPTQAPVSAQDDKLREPDFLAQLEREGYSNIEEALQRVIIGAYQLLQDDKVDQAEAMIAEGS